MRRLYRRDKQQYIYAGVVGAGALVAILFFLILYLPVRADYVELSTTIERLERESRERTARLERLEATARQLEEARRERVRFREERVIPRNQGYAALIPDEERLARLAGIDRDRVQYTTATEPRFGLYAVTISMPVRGDYQSLTRFIRELEAADTFFILDSIRLRQDQAAAGALDLTLNLTTFFADES